MSANPLAVALGNARRELELAWAAEEERELELTAAEKWARDPLGWLETFAWIASPFEPGRNYDAAFWLEPKRKLRPVRFELYPAQRETLAAWIDLEHLGRTGELLFRNLGIEKSRQIGETWVFAGAICWALHYHDVAGLAMHEKGAKIDDGGARNTIDSLFGKVRYIDMRLGAGNGNPLSADRKRVPGIGQPLVFRPFSRDPAKVESRERVSFVIGEGQTDNPGRGSTFDFFLGDEFAFVQHAAKVYSAIDEACPSGKALLSTVNGEGTEHARICDEKPAGYTVLRLHWSGHPIYSVGLHVAGEDEACPLCAGNRGGIFWNASEPRAHRYPGRLTSPWYDARVIGKTDQQVANELDIDRERALAGRVYPEFQSELHVVPGGIPYDDHLGVGRLELFWDYGADLTAVVVCQDAPEEFRVLGLLEQGDLVGTTATPDRVDAALREYLVALGVRPEHLAPVWTRRMRCIGDPNMGRSLDTGRTIEQAYRRYGWQIQPSTRYQTVEPSIVAVKRLLTGIPKPLRVCGLNAAEFALHFRNNSWPTDATGRRRLGSTKPEDDIHNHSLRAFAYGVVAKWPPQDLFGSEVGGGSILDDDDEGSSSGIRPGMSF